MTSSAKTSLSKLYKLPKTTEELSAMWEEEAPLGEDLEEENRKIANLMAKYLNLRTAADQLRINREAKMNDVERQLYLYYRGAKETLEEHGYDEPWQLQSNHNEAKYFALNDPAYLVAKIRFETASTMFKMCDMILAHLNKREHILRNIHEDRKLRKGYL